MQLSKIWNRIKKFFKDLFGKKTVATGAIRSIRPLKHPKHIGLSAKKQHIQKINGANKIYNRYVRFGRIFAQQAANAYYMKGRLGLREFLK